MCQYSKNDHSSLSSQVDVIVIPSTYRYRAAHKKRFSQDHGVTASDKWGGFAGCKVYKTQDSVKQDGRKGLYALYAWCEVYVNYR